MVGEPMISRIALQGEQVADFGSPLRRQFGHSMDD
jgi:hypothetical protein